MSRVHAPTVASALSGFVLGVVVTLTATGTLFRSSRTNQPSPTPPIPTPIGDPQMYAQISRILVRQLGLAYPDTKQPRLLSLHLLPVAPNPMLPVPGEGLARYRSLNIHFRLNDHPLGKLWRLKAAKGDVFRVMRALYLSQLPVYNVEMDGYFPLPSNRGLKLQRALVAQIANRRADSVPWRRWGREQEGRFWSLLNYTRVDPRFA